MEEQLLSSRRWWRPAPEDLKLSLDEGGGGVIFSPKRMREAIS
jgi:hypothetical protein